MKKNRSLAFCISLLSVTLYLRSNDGAQDCARIEMFNDVVNNISDVDNSEGYDEYDEQFEEWRGPKQTPKPVGRVQYWLRKIGSPILLKYLAIKTYFKNLWTRLVNKFKRRTA